MIDFFSLIFVGNGYGYFTDSPTQYVLKLFYPFWEIICSSVYRTIKNVFSGKPNTFEGLYEIPEGYQTLWEKVQANLPDVRLNNEISNVTRTKVYDKLDDVYSYEINITNSDGKWEIFVTRWIRALFTFQVSASRADEYF